MSGEKTEKATPKKLGELRKKGSVARSADLPSSVVLLVAVALLPSAMHKLAGAVQTSMVLALSSPTPDLEVARATSYAMITGAAKALGPLLAALAAASLLSAAALSRSRPNPLVLRPRAERISPKAGVKRLASMQALFDLTKASLKLALLVAVTWSVWATGYRALVTGPGTVDALVGIVRHSVGQLLLRTAILAVAVGLLDGAWSRRRFDKSAKMSKQDIQDEHKSSEGNPQMKGQIRARMRQMGRSRMIAAVAGADVVLANPTHLVVALRYTDGDGAPLVVAKGAGSVADRIKAEAAKHEVPVVADKPLARALYRATQIGDPVPVELYRAVAEVLAAVYRTRRRSA